MLYTNFNIQCYLLSYFYRIYIKELRQSQLHIDDAEINANLDQDFASWFEAHVSNINSTIYKYICWI